MATKRLIDAYKLEDMVRRSRASYHNKDDVIAAIAGQPTVDAVEVVRCEECLHYIPPDDGDFLGLCTSGILAVSNNGQIYPGRAFFCPYGERKDNED